MKALVVVTLIICGTAMVLAPTVHDYLVQADMQRLQEIVAARSDVNQWNLSADTLNYQNRWYLHVMGCWTIVAGILGAAAVFVADTARQWAPGIAGHVKENLS